MDHWKFARLAFCIALMLSLLAAGLYARWSLKIPVMERFCPLDWVGPDGPRPFPRRVDPLAELRDQLVSAGKPLKKSTAPSRATARRQARPVRLPPFAADTQLEAAIREALLQPERIDIYPIRMGPERPGPDSVPEVLVLPIDPRERP